MIPMNQYSDSCYEKNDTMKLLGKQHIDEKFGDEMLSQMNDIMKARPYSATFETALDILMLGYIFGKRAERLKKNKYINQVVG